MQSTTAGTGGASPAGAQLCSGLSPAGCSGTRGGSEKATGDVFPEYCPPAACSRTSRCTDLVTSPLTLPGHCGGAEQLQCSSLGPPLEMSPSSCRLHLLTQGLSEPQASFVLVRTQEASSDENKQDEDSKRRRWLRAPALLQDDSVCSRRAGRWLTCR